MKAGLLTILVFAAIGRAQSTTQPALDQAAIEREFQKTMTGATLVGWATNSAKPNTQPAEDRYIIQRVSKITVPPGGQDNGLWLLVWRAHVGGKDVSVPLMVPIKWAGDTPVISVTDLAIPGIGTYTARVVIYRDRYAGTWSGRAYGGHLWGRIERTSTTGPATQPVAP